MPRPKPPEDLFQVNYRLTRKQIRKVEQMGGPAWLRKLISSVQASKKGRDPIGHVRAMKGRNLQIVASELPNDELAKKHTLSVQRVRQIKKQYNESIQ